MPTNLFWSHRSRTIPQALDHLADALNDAAVPAPNPARQPDPAATDERVDQLLLVCAAMWELLSERAGLAENDLIAKIAEIDARDGTADGKLTYSPVQCFKCQRPIFAKQQRCLYCGSPRPADTLFKTI